MRLPLLVASTPRLVKQCAVVHVPVGEWKVIVENLLDSILSLPNGEVLKFEKATDVQLCIVSAGRESNLNVYLECLSP